MAKAEQSFQALVAANRRLGNLQPPAAPEARKTMVLTGMRLWPAEIEEARAMAAADERSTASFLRRVYLLGLDAYRRRAQEGRRTGAGAAIAAAISCSRAAQKHQEHTGGTGRDATRNLRRGRCTCHAPAHQPSGPKAEKRRHPHGVPPLRRTGGDPHKPPRQQDHARTDLRMHDAECGHTFVANTEVVRTLSPSATPDPTVNIPLSTHVQRDMVRIVLDHAAESAHQPQYTAPTTGDLFAGSQPAPGAGNTS